VTAVPLVDVFMGRRPDHRRELEEIIELLQRHERSVDEKLVRDAYELAEQVHGSQKRKNGKPYMVHPLAVARTCAEHWMTDVAVAAALLHDTLEDADEEVGLSEEMFVERFGEDVSRIVSGVTKFEKNLAGEGEDYRVETLKKLLHVTALEDIRIIILKIFDRHHNVRSLGVFREEKRRRIGEETIRFYVPMSDRLGFYTVSREMEDSVFKALQPRAYKELSTWVDRERRRKSGQILQIIGEIREALADKGIDAADKFKAKGLFYIHKMASSPDGEVDYQRLEEVPVFNITFVVPDTDACFRTLNLVHSKFTFLPEEVRDFINNPKVNGYQSIHTVVRGPGGSRITVIIRTSEMEWQNRQGVIADLRAGRLYEGTFLQDLVQSLDIINPSELLEMTGRLFFPEIDVTSPAGDSFKLPEGSTALDFAYHIHTDLGHRADTAIIGGQERKLDSRLYSGQRVEIRKAGEPRVKPVWMTWVTTDKARLAIRKYLTRLEREAVEAEPARFTAHLKRRHGISIRPAGSAMSALRESLDYETDEELGEDLLKGLLSYDYALLKLLPELSRRDLRRLARSLGREGVIDAEVGRELETLASEENLSSRLTNILEEHIERSKGACHYVEVEGARHPMAMHFAQCCRPSYGDPIVALTTRDGVTIHRDTCSKVGAIRLYDSLHLVGARWRQTPKMRRLLVQVEGDDRRNLLHDLTRVLAEFRINIVELTIRTIDGERFGGMILLEVSDLTGLDLLERRFRDVPALRIIDRWILP
jgi:GTP pyrophosphokinase